MVAHRQSPAGSPDNANSPRELWACIERPPTVAPRSGPTAATSDTKTVMDARWLLMTPAERSLRSRMAAYRLHASHDPKDTTRAARAAFLSRFEREVDPDATLTPTERSRRAEAARKAYFTKLAIQSARARRNARRSLSFARRTEADQCSPSSAFSVGWVVGCWGMRRPVTVNLDEQLLDAVRRAVLSR
jgi:hypothetical protein